MKMVTDQSPSKGASSTSRSSLVDGCAAIKGLVTKMERDSSTSDKDRPSLTGIQRVGSLSANAEPGVSPSGEPNAGHGMPVHLAYTMTSSSVWERATCSP